MKIVVVSGGTKGLGFAIASNLLNDGYRVIIIGRSTNDNVEQLAQKYPTQLILELFDFNDTASIHGLCTTLVKQYGRPYALINNAALGHDGVLATMHDTQISELIRVNVEAPILLTKYLIRPMLINQCGRIINISSIIASTGFNGLAVYGASKAALSGFTKSLCREVGKAGITVNTIAPGYMETEMTSALTGDKLAAIKRRSPLGKLAKSCEVAQAVNYLLSDAASSITGSTMTIDAGSTA